MMNILLSVMTWIHHGIWTGTYFDYAGSDIVPGLVERFFLNFSQDELDAKPLPESYVLVFTCKMTQHLTTADIIIVLKHISSRVSDRC